MEVKRKEYASKGVAGTGLGLGIAGTALGLANGGGGGVLSGLFGGGGCAAALAEKDAQIAKLEAEKYSDNAAKEEANRLLSNYLKPYGDAIAASQVKEATLAAEIECLKKTQALEMQLMAKDIQLVKQELTCCCTANATAIAQVNAILSGITKTVVPNGAICPGWGAAEVTVKPATTTTT